MTATLVRWGATPPTQARINWSRWIADCPACGSALAVQRGQHDFGAWTPDGFASGCWDCGTRTVILWPADDLAAGVERMLSMRPDPKTRNWTPGETLHDLMVENAHAGIFTQPALDAGPGLELLAVEGDRIVVDALPATPAIDRPARHQIGA